MASAKQIAWRKKFARMSKAGKFRKETRITKENLKIVRENPKAFKGGVKGYMKTRRAEKKPKSTKSKSQIADKSLTAICGICGKTINKSKYYQHTGTHFN